MAINTPGSTVPLGQANTGSAFVLDQRTGLAPLTTLIKQNQVEDAVKAREAKLKADEQARNLANQQRLLDKPEEFGLHYQNLGAQKINNYLDLYASKIKANGGKPLDVQQQAEVRTEQLRLNQWAQATRKAEQAAVDLRNNLVQNKYYKKDEVENQARSLFFDQTGQINRDPSAIDWDQGFQAIASNPNSINIGAVSNDFVKSLTERYREKFSSNGTFDFKTIETYKLPIQITPNGSIDYDNSGRPILKVTPALMAEVNKMPEFSTYLDGKEKEENVKSDTDPNYLPKTRHQLVREVLDSEVYAKTIQSRTRIPVRRPPVTKAEKPKSTVSVNTAGSLASYSFDNPATGKTETQNRYNRLESSIGVNSGKGGQYVSEISTPSFISISEDGKTTQHPTNTSNLKVAVSGITYLATNPKTGNALFPPKEIKTPEEYDQWFEKVKQNPTYRDYEFQPFIRGTATDEAGTLLDFPEARKKVIEQNQGKQMPSSLVDALAQDMVEKQARITKTKRAVFIPYRGKAKLDADAQTNNGIVPTPEMDEVSRRLNSIKSTSTRKDVFGFEAAPKPTQTKTPTSKYKTTGRNNALGF